MSPAAEKYEVAQRLLAAARVAVAEAAKNERKAHAALLLALDELGPTNPFCAELRARWQTAFGELAAAGKRQCRAAACVVTALQDWEAGCARGAA